MGADISIGPVILDGDVERAVRDTLQAWMPWYLARIDEARGREPGTTDPPRTWDVASEATTWGEETPPALLVHTPGPDATEQHGARGTYGGIWQVNIGVTAGGATEEGSRDLAHRHAAAIRFVIGQHRDMGGIAQDTRWGGSRSDILPRNRKMLACEVVAFVRVAEVLDTRGISLPVTPTDPGEGGPVPTGYRVRVTRS